MTLQKSEKLKSELISAYLHDNFSLEELCNAIKNDILLADSILFPFSYPLSAHQRVTFQEFEEGKFIFMQACRGGSKSYMIARYMLLKALTWPMAGIFTAPTFRQALLGFKYAETLIRENSTIRNPINLMNEVIGQIVGGGGQSSEARIKFKNTSILKALPMGDGEKLRGERADILACDEFFKMDRELFRVHILPFLYKPMIVEKSRYRPPRPEAKLILATSAEYEDCYAYHFLTNTMLPKVKHQKEVGGRRKYIVIDWNIDDLNDSGFPLEPDIIELQTSDVSKEEKQRALYNKWVGISGQFFPTNITEKIIRPEIKIEHQSDGQSTYALSVDVAMSEKGDMFIIQVWKFLGDRKMALINSYWNKGLTPDDMAYQIHQFDEKFHPEWIYMDKGGGGLAVTSSLAKRKLILADGREIPIESPILLHDEFRLLGQKKLILNRPADPKVRRALMGDRPTGQEEISHEEQVLHLTFEGIKLLLTNEDPLIVIPEFATQNTDQYFRSDIEILDNIRESVHQLRHLAMKINELADGTKEIVRTLRSKVPYYIWKGRPYDAGITFAYGFIPYMLHYQSELGEENLGPAMIFEPVLYEDAWLKPFLEDQQGE